MMYRFTLRVKTKQFFFLKKLLNALRKTDTYLGTEDIFMKDVDFREKRELVRTWIKLPRLDYQVDSS